MSGATRAAVLERHTDSAPTLGVTEVEIDEPRSGEVLVDIAYASLCHSDLSVITGDRPRPTPMVLGHEASGRVLAVGSGVTAVEPGDHVVFTYVPSCGRCRLCVNGKPVLCERGNAANREGELVGGGRRLHHGGTELHHHLGISAFAGRAVSDQTSVVKLPEGTPLREAALLGCAVLTGAGAVFNAAPVRPGTSAAVFGCGGVGLAAILGLKAAGAAPIIAVDRGTAQLELAAELGADVCLQADDGVPAAVRDLTAGGVDNAFDASAALPAIESAYACCAPGGQVTLLGLPHPDTRWSISPAALVAGDLTVRGSYMGSSTPRRDLARLLAMHETGRLPVGKLISRTIELDDIAGGMQALESGVAGRIVVDLTTT